MSARKKVRPRLLIEGAESFDIAFRSWQNAEAQGNAREAKRALERAIRTGRSAHEKVRAHVSRALEHAEATASDAVAAVFGFDDWADLDPLSELQPEVMTNSLPLMKEHYELKRLYFRRHGAVWKDDVQSACMLAELLHEAQDGYAMRWELLCETAEIALQTRSRYQAIGEAWRDWKPSRR